MKRTVVIAWIAVLIGFAIGYLVGKQESRSQEIIAGGSHTGNAIEVTIEQGDSSTDSSEESRLEPLIDSLENKSSAFLAIPASLSSETSSSSAE